MTDREAMQMALEALEYRDGSTWLKQGIAAEALRAQLEQPEQEPVAHSVISGALFDFMGWLTTREERLALSITDNASPAVDAIKDFAKMRSLSLDDARVQDWKDYTTPPAAQRKPFDILAITTAYEQGVGKGHQAQGRGIEIDNPYTPGECQQAWSLGYTEGRKQAAPKVAHGIGEKP